MSRPFAQPKVQEVLVATYTPPFIETLRVDVLQRPIELTPDFEKVVEVNRRAALSRDQLLKPFFKAYCATRI